MKSRNRSHDLPTCLGGALLLTLIWLVLMRLTSHEPQGHSSYDTYTLMALAWRKGLLHLEQDYPWLELAIFNGAYYVSFPPLPTVVMWLLSFAFGANTPSNLVNFSYFLMSYFVGYALARRWAKPATACMRALFLTLGCSLLACTMDGGVWYQAQLLAFLLLLICAYGLTDERPVWWGIGLFALALSVGCRPFDAVFVPFALYTLFGRLRKREEGLTLAATVRKMVPYCLAPAAFALLLAWYNWVRFGNPLEFGHNYLPEFTRNPETPQLGTQYIVQNLENILRLPAIEGGRIDFGRFEGFAFYLANPLYVWGAMFALLKLLHFKWDMGDALLVLLMAAEALLLLMHKTFGGWQFGTRYLCDLLPMVYLFAQRGSERRSYKWEWALAAFAIALNAYGTWWIYCTG